MGTPIFTRLLTPEEYGIFPLYNTWIGVFTVVVTLEITGGAMYRGLQKFSDKKDEFISAAFGLFTSIFILFCTLLFAFNRFLIDITGLSLPILLIMFLQIFANTIIAFYTAKARFEYNYKNVAILNLASAFGTPLLSVLLILMTKLGGISRIVGSSLTLTVISIPIGYLLLKKSQKLFDKDIWKFLLKFCLPLLPHYFSMTLIMRIGEITVGRYFGNEALGKYSVALSLGMSLTIITNGLLSALSPWMLRKINSHETERIKDFLLLCTKALSVMCLIILSLSPEFIKILTPSDFHSSLPAIYPLELAVIPMFLSNALMSGQMYYEKSGISALPSIICATISAALSLTVLPMLDYRFVSVFVLFSYLVLAFLNTAIFKRISGEMPLLIKQTIVVFSLTIGYASLLFLFRDVLISRVILLIPLLPMLAVLGKQILSRIKE